MRRESGNAARLLLAGLCLAAAAGCAPQEVRGKMHYNIGNGEQQKRVMFPPGPEVPRFMFAGELTGEQNFRSESDDARATARNVFAWVVGLFEQQPDPLVLQRPQSGAVDEAAGRIYVTDVSRGGVYVFDEKGEQLTLWDFAKGFRRFIAPVGIVVGPAGKVYVADAEAAAVIVLDGDGNFVLEIGAGVLKRPTGLARDPAQGLLYVSDTHAHDIKVFDDEGHLLNVIGRRGEAPGEFNFPTHLAFREGELYVTDTFNNRIQVLSREGEPVRRFGQRGLYVGNLVRPKGVAVDDEGNIYVVESYYDHLLVYNSEGQFLMGIGGTGKDAGKFYLPAGVWVDSHNRVYVADMFNGRVAIFQFLGGSGG